MEATHHRTTRPAWRSAAGPLAASVLLVASCGGAPTAESEEEAPSEADTAEALDAVYAEVDGLTGDERRNALIELATDECDEPIDLYTSINTNTSQPLIDRFVEDTGIQAQLYRAANQDILRRVQEEERAQVTDVADVIANNDLEQAMHERDGVLAPLDTPVIEDNPVVYDTWAGVELYVYIAAWNTDAVAPDEAPTSWEEVFEADGLAYQFGDLNWFATLVNDWYVEEQGVDEREAVDLIKQATTRGTQSVDGHTLGAQLLVAGEYRVASSLYHHTVALMMEEGANIAWEPLVEPAIMRSTGVGLHRRTPCPASALLLTEYMVTDFQPMLPEHGRAPAAPDIPGGFPTEYDTMPIDLDLILDDYDRWAALHDEITGAIGGDVLEE